MIKAVKFMLFIVPSIFMGLIILFVPDIADVSSISFVTLTGVFLGVDMVAMIKETKTLPKGSFEKLNPSRVVVVAMSLFALTCLAFYQYKTTGLLKITLGSLSASVFVISGLVLIGLDGNKIATESPL